MEPSAIRGFVGLNAIYDVPLLQQNYPKYREVRTTENETDWKRTAEKKKTIDDTAHESFFSLKERERQSQNESISDLTRADSLSPIVVFAVCIWKRRNLLGEIIACELCS